MKKTVIVILTLFSLSAGVFAQKSPVTFLNNTCTINVDTTYGEKFVRTHLIDLQYKFVNKGEHVTFIETKDTDYYGGKLPDCITKPKDTTVLVLNFDKFFDPRNKNGLGIQKHTSSVINVPFYYEGEIYNEKLTLNCTFGKSKLIEYDNPLQIVTDSVAKFFIYDNNNDTTIMPDLIHFTFYYSVKNITNKPIWCTKAMIGWYDVPEIRDMVWNGRDFIIIPPHKTYKIPIQMCMASKHKFSKGGNIIVFSENVFEVHTITLKSDFEPQGKYKYKY